LIKFIKNEAHGIYSFLSEYRKETVIICAAALVLSLQRYHPVWNGWFSQLLYFFIIPVLIILLVLRKNPLDFGLRLGDFKIWGKYVLITCVIGAPILYFTSKMEAFELYYAKEAFSLSFYSWTTIITLAASEFMFRGFLLFGLKDKFKEGSILIQMIPFVITHFGKPEIETVSCIITGILFGFIAYRGKSYWPILIIHIFINIFFVAIVNLG